MIWGKDPLQWVDEWEEEQILKAENRLELLKPFDIESWRKNGVYSCPICKQENNLILDDLRKNNLRPSEYFLKRVIETATSKCYGHEEGEDLFLKQVDYKIHDVIRWIKDIPTNFDKLKFRIKNGFWYEESWNFDYEFCKWALPRLKHLNKHGVSMAIIKEVGENEPFEKAEQYQNEIINKILWSLWFGQYKYKDEAHSCEHEKYKEGMLLLGKYMEVLND